MSKPRSFFRIIWKFNAIAIACASVIGILLGGLALYEFTNHMLRQRQVTNIAVAAPESGQPEQKIATYDIGQFTKMRGSEVLWAPLHLRQKFQASYRSKAARSVANYVFYDPKTGKDSKLLQSNAQIIIQTHYLARDPHEKNTPIQALAFEIVEKDTNGDGVMTRSDARRLALSKPDGTNLKRLPQMYAGILGTFVLEDGTLVLLVRHGEKVQALHVSGDTFTVAATQAVNR
jgi:hypothetical protein